jgi:HD-GYP domain-containing protein (c-di-GMP phosphodiesterase class II)
MEDYNKKIEEAYSSAKSMSLLLKYNMPPLNKFIKESAMLAVKIGGLFGLDNKDEYILACLYANISMTATAGVEFYGKLDAKQHEFFKKHTIRSADMLEEMGLHEVAEIVKYHHEKPNAKGYHRQITYPFESNLIRIADEFCMMIRPSPKRLNNAYDLKEAARNVLAEFRDYDKVVSEEAQRRIYKILIEHEQ